MPRGGRRAGRAGTAYTNRSDLTSAPKPLPVSTSTGQQYGAAAQQSAAQQAVPMASGPIAPATAGAPAPTTAPSPPRTMPGQFPPLDRPTERPHEPVTTGAPFGPGAGPEVLSGSGRLADIIAQAAASSGSTDLGVLAQRARTLGQ